MGAAIVAPFFVVIGGVVSYLAFPENFVFTGNEDVPSPDISAQPSI